MFLQVSFHAPPEYAFADGVHFRIKCVSLSSHTGAELLTMSQPEVPISLRDVL
jgi:hypothetical protein